MSCVQSISTGIFTFEEIELTQSQLDARLRANNRIDKNGNDLVAIFYGLILVFGAIGITVFDFIATYVHLTSY